MKYIALIMAFSFAALTQQLASSGAKVFESYIAQHLHAQHIIESTTPGTLGQCEASRPA